MKQENILGQAAILLNGIAVYSCYNNSNKLFIYAAILAVIILIFCYDRWR